MSYKTITKNSNLARETTVEILDDVELNLGKLSNQELVKIFFNNGGTIGKGDYFCVPFPTCIENTLAHFAYRILSDRQRLFGIKTLFILITRFRKKEIDKHGNELIPK